MKRFMFALLAVGALVAATATVSQSSARHAKSAAARSTAVVAAVKNEQSGGTCPLGSCPLGSCSKRTAARIESSSAKPMSPAAASSCPMDPASCPTSCPRGDAASTAVALTTH